MNKQPPEGVWFDKDGRLEVHSIFRSIQGEGPFVGWPAVFIRLAGCDVCCDWCDTDYTSSRAVSTVDEVQEQIEKLALHGELVVLTGGEPFRQNIDPLCRRLVVLGYRVQIETNGTLFNPGLCAEVTIVVSPKPHHKVDLGLSWRTTAWKYVIRSGDTSPADGLPLGVQRCPPGAVVYIQPMDEGDPVKNKENQLVAVNSCMVFGHRLSLQIHKLLGMP